MFALAKIRTRSLRENTKETREMLVAVQHVMGKDMWLRQHWSPVLHPSTTRPLPYYPVELLGGVNMIYCTTCALAAH